MHVKAAILVILKNALLCQEAVTLTTLVQLLNQRFLERQSVPLVNKVGESEFISLVNSMVTAGEVMQIKQCFSIPYSAITLADIE